VFRVQRFRVKDQDCGLRINPATRGQPPEARGLTPETYWFLKPESNIRS
jgi:hypothetical protein